MQPQSRKRNDISARLQLALRDGENAVIEAAEDADPILDFAHSAARTLSETPKRLECRFLYDARGSELFDRICELPEYYITRTEASLLDRHSEEISRLTGPLTLVELGSGSSVKTQHIFSAYLGLNGSTRYVPVDVSMAALRQAGDFIGRTYPGIRVIGINGTYDCAFPLLKELSPVMVIFLGSTIGNLHEHQEAAFWRNVARSLAPGDFFLLGVDLVKNIDVLESAYNDRAGISAAFTINLLERMNRELGAGIDLDHVEYVAGFSHEKSCIDIYLRFNKEQRVRIRPLDKYITVSAGERIHVEISRKFRLDELVPRLSSLGFRTVRTFTDENDWFSLLLLERVGTGNE